MVQLVSQESTFTWMTFALVLLPGTAVGMSVGWAAYRRATGRRPSACSVLSPALLAAVGLLLMVFWGRWRRR